MGGKKSFREMFEESLGRINLEAKEELERERPMTEIKVETVIMVCGSNEDAGLDINLNKSESVDIEEEEQVQESRRKKRKLYVEPEDILVIEETTSTETTGKK